MTHWLPPPALESYGSPAEVWARSWRAARAAAGSRCPAPTEVGRLIDYLLAIARSQTGAWSWLLHRITGVGVLIFLLAHIVDTALIGLGPDAYEHALDLYRMPIFKVGEIALVFAVVYHSVNGIRV